MQAHAWLGPHNATVSGVIGRRHVPLSIVMLPFSLSCSLCLRGLSFPLSTRVVHFVPLRIERSRGLSGSSVRVEAGAPLVLDRCAFAGAASVVTVSGAAPVTVTRCSFAGFAGPAVAVSGGASLRVKWSLFKDSRQGPGISVSGAARALVSTSNFTALGGGAIRAASSSLQVRGCQFTRTFGRAGGGVEAREGDTTIDRCGFLGCGASERGGAVGLSGGVGVIRRSSFWENEARLGSSLSSLGGRLEVAGCAFDGSRVWEIHGDVSVVESVFDSGAVVMALPTPSDTFTPSPAQTQSAQSALPPPGATPSGDGSSRNTELIIGCTLGAAAFAILVGIIVLVVTKVRNVNNPKIYVTSMTERKPPVGALSVSQAYSLGQSQVNV